MQIHHDDRPPGALAHGPVKTNDIERVRGDIAQAAKGAAGYALSRTIAGAGTRVPPRAPRRHCTCRRGGARAGKRVNATGRGQHLPSCA